MAMFCIGRVTKSLTHIPPIETLGHHFYVPAIDLVGVGASGLLTITSTHDSTVVTVRGDFDRRDTLLWAGTSVVRDLTNSTVS